MWSQIKTMISLFFRWHLLTGTPPKIEALPQNISAELGKPLSVSGVFSGDPTPSVQWICSGRTLLSGDERCRVENTADLTTLIISAVKVADAGAYTLRLSNELGSDTGTVNIHIRSMWKKKKKIKKKLIYISFPSSRTFLFSELAAIPDKIWICVLVNINYFCTKLDINLCQTRLKSKVVIKCAILDNSDFWNTFLWHVHNVYSRI